MDHLTQQLSDASLADQAPRSSPVRQPVTKGSFFSLPLEIRQLIYFHTLRVDCGRPSRSCQRFHRHVDTHRGSTKVLGLCSQSYREAIVYLHDDFEAVLRISGSSRTIFRLPFANGAPNHFVHLKNDDRVCIPQTYSQLNVLRLPRIVLDICFPDEDESSILPSADDRRMMSNLERQIGEVLYVLQKNRELKEVTLSLHRRVNVPRHFLKHHPGLQRLIFPILQFAAENSLAVPIKNNAAWNLVRGSFFSSFPMIHEEPMIAVLMNDAIDLNVSTRLIPRDDRFDNLRGGAPPRDLRSLEPDKPYKLLPECRYCLQPFRDWDQLHDHLENRPQHQTPFVEMERHELHPRASLDPSNYVCLTCAKQYVTLGMLAQHYEMFPRHCRIDTVAPRYAQVSRE